jgi:succinate dehydrogenase / fumarate reductase flavoprotein subunit
VAELERLRNSTGQEKVGHLRDEMQKIMMSNVGVFRTAKQMQAAVDKLRELKARYQHASIDDKGKRFNTDLLEAWELGSLLDLAEVTAVSALARQESRGGHSREDFPKRDDTNWLKHTLAYKTDEGIELKYKPVVITKFQPKERVY